MKKEKHYPKMRFTAEALREAIDVFRQQGKGEAEELDYFILQVQHDDSTWTHDDFDEFISDYRKYNFRSMLYVRLPGGKSLEVTFDTTLYRGSNVSVSSPTRTTVNAVFDVFEKHIGSAQRFEEIVGESQKKEIEIFIGHGRNQIWRELRDHLQDKHHLRVQAYESGSRAGHSIRDILQEMITDCSFAILVMTAEDIQADDSIRCRQNVVHEAGLFQGRLGFSKAIVLKESGTELFSNLDGIQYIEFSHSNIKETFGEVLATIKREFG